MSKATLTFNLPDEDVEFRHAVNGQDYSIALYNIQQDVRQIYKYRELSEDAYKVVEEIYEQINQRLTEVKFIV